MLALIAEGASNKAIARRLTISVHTVKFHIASLLDKLDAQDRAEAVAQGARLGAIRLEARDRAGCEQAIRSRALKVD